MSTSAKLVAAPFIVALGIALPSLAAATPGSRLRTHVEGSLEVSGQRRWVGPALPGYVPYSLGTLELFLLDEVPEGHFALYREPYGAGSCTVSVDDARNCRYRLRLYGPDGALAFDLDPGPLLSRPDHLEIADVRYVDRTVYLNEACQSYAREARGRCSALVALEPREGRVLWRTRPLVSNDVFLPVGDYLVAGYGFTSERDFVSLVRRADGRMLSRVGVRTAPDDLGLADDGIVRVLCHPEGTEPLVYRLRIVERKPGIARLVVVEGPSPRAPAATREPPSRR